MKPKTNFTLIIITLSLFVAACTSGGTSTGTAEVNYRVGTSGLSMQFVKNTPPQKVFEGDTFPAMISIKNNGAYSIPQDSAYLSLGVERDYTRAIQLQAGGRVSKANEDADSSAKFNLDGRSQINSPGDEEVISYSIQAGKIDPQSETHTSALIATLCYPYETILESDVCIDTDVNNLRPGKKVCSQHDLSFGSGQGAPVTVTRIETRMLPNEITKDNGVSDRINPQFLIYVENIGSGLVIKQGTEKEFCTKSSALYANYNQVYVNVFLSNDELECQIAEVKKDPNDPFHIKLKDKKDIIRCNLKKGSQGITKNLDNYLSPLKVVLKYGYSQSMAANYAIQKPVS